MKKLMVAAAIAFAAVCANAASVSWMLSDVTDSPKATAAAGWAAYFLDASTYDAFTALSGAEAVNYAVANQKWGATTTLVESRYGDSINVQGAGTANPLDTVNGYIVLLDAADSANANYYAFTATKSGTISEGGAPMTLDFGTFASGTSGWQAAAVPEPTSGLLLLLGMAGLALRRRRA